MLYNSPYAVTLLFVGLLLALAGLGIWIRALLRTEKELRSRSERPLTIREMMLRRELRDAVLSAAGFLALTALLLWAVGKTLG